MTAEPTANLFDLAASCLSEHDPARKVALTFQAASDWREGRLTTEQASAGSICETAGRPARLELVQPRQLAARRLNTRDGRAA